MTSTEKPHPLKGRKKSAAAIKKLKATLAEKRRLRESGELPPRKSPTAKKPRKNARRVETRTHEQLVRDMAEVEWCLTQAVKKTREKIRSGLISLTDVTDEEAYMYMAIRYAQGGLKP